jgi:putative glycosyltransferase (TIGR04372 family)
MLRIFYDFFLNLLYPIVIIVKIISKFKLIKFGEIIHSRIGHLVGELSLWHLQNKDRNQSSNYWYVSNKVCNPFFVDQIKKKINISSNIFIKIIHDVLKKFKQKDHIINGPLYGERDLESLVYKNENLINFSDKEIKLGDSLLENMGIKKHDTIVCMCIRDNFYFKKNLKEKYNYKNSEFKNSNIENYNKAVKFLNQRNIKVVRMGVGSEKEWSLTDNKFNFDYSKSEFRSGFMDFYLVNRSKFTITNGTGFYWIPYILKKPLVMADFIPIGAICSYVPYSLHIFKRIYSKNNERELCLNELVSEEFNYIYKNDDYKAKNLEYINNSPEEIFDCVKEMNDQLDNKFNNDNTLQKKFWDLIPKKLINIILTEKHII